MKKNYETPSAEKIDFMYREQVVAASGNVVCHVNWYGYNGKSNPDCWTDKIFHGDESPF